MIGIPQSSKAYPRTRMSPLRLRYVAFAAVFFLIYYFFIHPTHDYSSTYQKIPQMPEPIHAAYDVEKDSFSKNSPLWHDKASSHGDVPAVPQSKDTEHDSYLIQGSQLNYGMEDNTADNKPSQPIDAPYVDISKISAEAQALKEAMGGSQSMDEPLAEVLRLHENDADYGVDSTKATNKNQPNVSPLDATKAIEEKLASEINALNLADEAQTNDEINGEGSGWTAFTDEDAAAAAEALAKAAGVDGTTAGNDGLGSGFATAEEDAAAIKALEKAAGGQSTEAGGKLTSTSSTAIENEKEDSAAAALAKAAGFKELDDYSAPVADNFAAKEQGQAAADASPKIVAGAGLIGAAVPQADAKSATRPASTLELSNSASSPAEVFKQFDFLFAFGDSWSYTGFDLSGPQPTASNPLGNPGLPMNGSTSPPEWLYYMTTKYNSSFLRTYNIARGAATVDRAVVPPHPGFAFTWTFKEQAADAFGLAYSRPTLDIHWATQNTLFASWFGVVDTALLLEREEWTESINSKNLASYSQSLETLYGFGGRRFLLLNCPPLARMPGAKHTDVSIPAVKKFNDGLRDVQKQFLAKHAGDIEAEMYYFDVHQLLSDIIDDPKTTPQTVGLKNTTDNCWNYNPDANPPTQSWSRFDAECGVPYDQYFWANPLHPTYPVHDAIAARIVKDCFTTKGKTSGYCAR